MTRHRHRQFLNVLDNILSTTTPNTRWLSDASNKAEHARNSTSQKDQGV